MTRNFLPNFSCRETVFSRREVNSSSDKSILIRMDILTMIKVLTWQISKTMTKPWSIEKPNKSIHPLDSKQSVDSGWLSHFKSSIIYDSLELGAFHPQIVNICVHCEYLRNSFYLRWIRHIHTIWLFGLNTLFFSFFRPYTLSAHDLNAAAHFSFWLIDQSRNKNSDTLVRAAEKKIENV